MSAPSQRPARGPGWRALRRERMARFRPDFARLRSSLRRTELVGSVVELFFDALLGVGRIQLGGRRPAAPPPADGGGGDDPEAPKA